MVNTTENIEILLCFSVQKIIISSLITIKGQMILQSFNITMCYITEIQSRKALIPADANKCFYKLARQKFSLLFVLPTLILGCCCCCYGYMPLNLHDFQSPLFKHTKVINQYFYLAIQANNPLRDKQASHLLLFI